MASKMNPNYWARSVRALTLALLASSLAACGPAAGADGGSGAGGGSGSLDLDEPYNNLTLGKPNTLPLAESEGTSGVVEGAAFRVDIASENVEQDETRARFRPNWAANTPNNLRRLAAAFYFIDLNEDPEPPALLLNWLAEPTNDNLWVGLADWDENRWVWRKLEDVANVELPSHSRFRRGVDGFMACVVLVLGTENSILEDLAIETQEPPPPGGFTHQGYPLGVNLDELSDWNRTIIFTDVFKMSREWIPQLAGTTSPWDTGKPIITDENGWVTSLAPGDSAMALLMTDQSGNYPNGRYVCLYDGDGGNNSDAFLVRGNGEIVPGSGSPGRFEIDINHTGSSTIFKIDKINPADYIRNIRVILPGFESSYNTTNVFHPDFLTSLEPFGMLRLMEWGKTKNSTVVNWADRTPPGYCRVTGETGAPIETMVQLCNTAQKDLWYSIPHMATDDYVMRAATLIRDTLDPNLRLFLENSNEVWNGIFEQRHWSFAQGQLLWPGDNNAHLHFYGLRTAQMMDVATGVFANETAERLVRVIATQSANPWAGAQSMDQEVSGPGDPAYAHVDVLAIAPYFGGTLGSAANEATTELMTVNEVLDFCNADSIARHGPGGSTEANFNNAAARGLALMAYEGGQHLVGVGAALNNQTIEDLFIAANRHPRMRQLYRDDLIRWTARGGSAYFLFNHLSKYSKYGSWGLLESQTQSRATAYKWNGMLDWLATVWN